MSVDVLMPKLGESITEGTILEWKKEVGDDIKKDETLLEISTDKVDSEIPSPESGKIIQILYKVNDVVPVGEVIARIGSNNDKVIKQVKHKWLIGVATALVPRDSGAASNPYLGHLSKLLWTPKGKRPFPL